MPSSDRARLARACYKAYETGDRQAIEQLIADDFAFWSPQDDGIDRAAYFERCWPNSEHIESFDFKNLVEFGDQVLVTYVGTRTDGSRFRNTEIMTFNGDKIARQEVYFGWNLE